MEAETVERQWKREMGQEYLVVTAKGEWQDVIAAKMLEHNEISGFLPFEMRYLNNQLYFYYALRQGNSIMRCFQNHSPDFKTLLSVYQSLAGIWKSGLNFFLPEQGYLVDKETIYWDNRKRQIFVCYVPGYAGDFKESVLRLTEYIMQCIEKNDRKASLLLCYLHDTLSEGEDIYTAVTDGMKRFTGQNEMETGQLREERSPYNIPEGQKKEEVYQLRLTMQEFYEEFQKSGVPDYFRILTEKRRDTQVVIGRGHGCDIRLPFRQLSRKHALLSYSKGKWYVKDLASSNGTYINGEKVKPDTRVILRKGDCLTLAEFTFSLTPIRDSHY